MALVVRELTSARLQDADDAIGNVGSWFDDDYRCDAGSRLPDVQEVRAYLSESPQRQRVVVIFDNVANVVVGLSIVRATSSPATARIRWLVARPSQFGQVASALCAAVRARFPNVDIWGCVTRDVQRARFTATGNFAVVNIANVAANHPIANYPDGTCIRYTA
jgi:hypothetical protein